MGVRGRMRVAWVGVLALLTAGCGSGPAPVAEVQGTVRQDGKTLANVIVEFLPDPEKNTSGPRSTATTDDQGRYRLRCDDGRTGALVGWHRVVVLDAVEERPAQGQVRKTAPRIGADYATAAKTPLRKEVQAGGPHTIDLEVSR